MTAEHFLLKLQLTAANLANRDGSCCAGGANPAPQLAPVCISAFNTTVCGLTLIHSFYSKWKDLSYHQCCFSSGLILSSLAAMHWPNRTIGGWCTSAKSRLAQNTNYRCKHISPYYECIDTGLFISLLLLTTAYFMWHRGNGTSQAGKNY